MEAFNLAQLTKEMVVGQLRNLADPTLVAAEIVRGTLIARLNGRKQADHARQEAVIEICRGAMAGLVLSECPLPRAVSQILIAVEAAAKAVGMDAEMAQIAALRGVSDLKRFVSENALLEILDRLRLARPKAAEELEHFLGDLHRHQSHPGYVPPSL